MSTAEAVMPLEADGSAEEDSQKSARYKRWLGAMAVNSSIVAGTAAAYFGERSGLMANWPHLLHEVGTSLGHPGPAFMGARLAVYLSFAKNKMPILMTAAAGAALTDAVQEETQSMLVDHNYNVAAPVAAGVLNENIKDFSFAVFLGGAAAARLALRSEARFHPVSVLGRIIPSKGRNKLPEQHKEVA